MIWQGYRYLKLIFSLHFWFGGQCLPPGICQWVGAAASPVGIACGYWNCWVVITDSIGLVIKSVIIFGKMESPAVDGRNILFLAFGSAISTEHYWVKKCGFAPEFAFGCAAFVAAILLRCFEFFICEILYIFPFVRLIRKPNINSFPIEMLFIGLFHIKSPVWKDSLRCGNALDIP